MTRRKPPHPRVESQFHAAICIESKRLEPGAGVEDTARSAALAPAQCVLCDAAADGVGDAGAGDRLPARDVRGVGLRRGPEDRRLRRCVSRFRTSSFTFSRAGRPRSPSSRFTRGTLAKGEEQKAQEAFNSTITIMTVVTLLGTILVEIFTPQLERLIFPKFHRRATGAVRLPDADPAAGADLLLRRRHRLCGAVFAPDVPVSGTEPGALRFVHHSGRTASARINFGIAALAYGALVGSFVGPFLINAIGAAKAGLRYQWSFDWRNPRVSRMGTAVDSADARRVAGFGGRLDPALLRFRRVGRDHAG